MVDPKSEYALKNPYNIGKFPRFPSAAMAGGKPSRYRMLRRFAKRTCTRRLDLFLSDTRMVPTVKEICETAAVYTH